MSEFKSWEELTELEQLACEYSDFYKAAYGFRPRTIDTSSWRVEDYQQVFAELAKVCRQNEAERLAEEEFHAHELELRIQNLLQSGAKDRAMAIRWIDEAEGANGDMNYLCYLVGVDYGYFDK